MANIIQIQDDLKNVSDQDLVNFVKRPTGQVPSYLALGEIKRRKETRDKYQGEKAKQKTTVVDDLVEAQGIGNQMTQNPMSQPTAGVGTPQPQEPINPAMLASKGIGQLNPGAVKQMNDGGIVGYAAGDLIRKTQAENAQLNYGMSPYSKGFAAPIGRQPFRQPEREQQREKILLVDSLEEQIAGVEAQPNTLDNINNIKELNRQLEAAKATPIKGGGYEQGDETLFSPMVFADKSIDSEPQEFVGTSMNVDETIKSTDDVVDGTVESLTKESITEDIDTDTDSKLDIADLDIPDILSKEQQDLFAGRRSNRPEVLSSEAALDQVLKTNKKAGLFDNPFDQDREDIDKERKLLDKAKSDAGSMAFIKAGLLWMQKGNLGDAAPAVTEYAQALKGLRGEDRELKKMDLALRGADIAYKQGNVKAASELTAAAQKRLDTFDTNTFTNMQQAMTQGLANRINIQKAILAKDTQVGIAELNAKTSIDAANITASKEPAAVALFREYAKDPLNQKLIEKEGVMVSVPDTAKIAELQRTSTYPPERQITSLGNIYLGELKQRQEAAKTQNPVAVKELESFNAKYPDGATDFIRKNMDIISSGQGSSQGSKFGQPTVVK
tara:strand:- start:1242 stop:3077 length:1836 start_codon:yes stop_codon:yes gene_type:complete